MTKDSICSINIWLHTFYFWEKEEKKLNQLAVSSGFFSCNKSNGVSDQNVKYSTCFVVTLIKGREFYRKHKGFWRVPKKCNFSILIWSCDSLCRYVLPLFQCFNLIMWCPCFIILTWSCLFLYYNISVWPCIAPISRHLFDLVFPPIWIY